MHACTIYVSNFAIVTMYLLLASANSHLGVDIYIVGNTVQKRFYRYQTEDGRFSLNYSCVKTRNSYPVAYINSDCSVSFGQILYFTCTAKHSEPVAVVKMFSVLNTKEHFELTFLLLNSRVFFSVSPTDEVINIPDR